VQAIVDFRMGAEHESAPDPQVPGATNCHLKVVEMEDFPVPEDLNPKAFDLLKDPNANRMELFDLSYDLGMLGPRLYEGFVLGERGKEAFAAFFRLLLELEDGRAILWHCTDGKDRTGCAAMLLLAALGADRETIIEDYLLTNEFNAPLLAATQQRLAGRPMPQDKLDALLFMVGKVSEAYLNRAFDAIEQSYGSVEGYLRDELGVGAEETRLLRDKFLA
jgi:protein-tyrosine phosphatase